MRSLALLAIARANRNRARQKMDKSNLEHSLRLQKTGRATKNPGSWLVKTAFSSFKFLVPRPIGTIVKRNSLLFILRAYIFKLFTCFYALLIVIGGVVIELSNLIADEKDNETIAQAKDLILGLWLFGGSIVFIGYCAVLVWQHHRSIHEQRKSLTFASKEVPSVLTNSSTGSLYLRIGCVVFGMIGVIYYGLIFVICVLGWSTESDADSGECTVESDILNFLAATFIFVQMWFVYCNGKIIFTGQGNIARVGLMHLCGTNLWMWLRYILYEEVETISEIRRAQNYTLAPAVVHHYHSSHQAASHQVQVLPSWEPYPDLDHGGHEDCKGVLCLFHGYNEFMYTCVVEYSLICAGVAFVFWTSLDREKLDTVERKQKKRSLLTIDCSRTAEGLFMGFGFIILTIIAIAVFNAYSNRTDLAQWIFSCTNLAFFAASTFFCCYAIWRMRVLRYGDHKNEEEESAELLDQILLVVGLIGELVFSIGGILSFINMHNLNNLAIVLFVTNILRLVQVTLQSGLILVSSKLSLKENDPAMMRYKPGKQIITLLLMTNCAQFLMNVFEAQKAGVDEEIVRMYGSYYWAVLIRGCSPLTIFYRFHSSACFAEIWKKTFRDNRRKHHHENKEAHVTRETEL